MVDLDLSLGDADVLLDTIPDYTLIDVAQNISRLDINLLKRSLTKHSSGLYLLPRPIQLQDAQQITPDDLNKAQETIGREIFWQIPNDYRTMVEVRNNGVPLIEQAPKAGLTQSIIGLANAISGITEETETQVEKEEVASRNWLKFWPGRSKKS